MKFVAPILMFLFSSSVFAAAPVKWSEPLVKDLNSKTLQETFCTKNVGYQAQAGCDYLKKNKVDLNKRITSARIRGNSLFLVSGKREIEIKLTGKPTEFEINRKVIDLKNYRDPAALNEVIRKSLPKLATRLLWINVAYAEGESNFEIMQSAALLMVQASFDDRWCAYAERFIRACNSNLSDNPVKTQWDMIAAKVKNKKPLTSDDNRWLQADTDELRVATYQMSKLVFDLKQAEVQSSLERCPSSNKPALKNAKADVLNCDKILTLKGLMLKDIPAGVAAEQNLQKVKLSDEQVEVVNRYRKEIVEWMEYITTSEQKAKVPDVHVDAPAVQ